MKETQYIKPWVCFIGNDSPAEIKLYELEYQLSKKLKECAEQWAKIMKVENNFWGRALPQAIFDLLDAFDHHASFLAALAYVETLKAKWPEETKAWSEGKI